MIEIEGLKKSFNGIKVLKGVDINVTPGKITAVLGPNGSGKTTLIKCILGMVIPDQGSIRIENKNILGHSLYRNKISYLPQIARFPDNLRVIELIRWIKDLRSKDTDESVLVEIFNLQPHLNKRLRSLSGGTRQKVNVVLGLMYDSPILIMDEPTAGLDPIALLHLKELIERQRSSGKTILFTTHIISLVEELADEIILLLEGQVYFKGAIHEIKESNGSENLERSIARILEREMHA